MSSSPIPMEAPMTAAAKAKAVDAFVKKTEKDYGAGTVMKLGERKIIPVKVVPTGFLHLDHEALMCGGIPRGRNIELFGPESSGKTSICAAIIAQFQSAGLIAYDIDAEHST